MTAYEGVCTGLRSMNQAETGVNEDEWLWGWDPTPGIVPVWAEGDGHAVVWRCGVKATRLRPT